MWHTLTNHPAHQKKPELDSTDSTPKPSSNVEKDKPEDEPKKASGSGSG
jgi:molecular chaperone DnaJ